MSSACLLQCSVELGTVFMCYRNTAKKMYYLILCTLSPGRNKLSRTAALVKMRHTTKHFSYKVLKMHSKGQYLLAPFYKQNLLDTEDLKKSHKFI